MAAESDGVPDMVSGDDQPIDLSRTPRKPLRVMPPLIPIKLLRAGYTAQQANKQVKGHDITLASLIKGKSDLKLFQDARSKCGEDISKPAQPVASAGEGSDADDEKEGEEDDEEDGEVSRKRVRLANGGERVGAGVGVGEGEGGSGGERWQRLDRARSVPQLTPLPLPLQRSKSLSESRIPAAAGAAAAVAAAAAAAAAAGHLPRGDTPTLARPAAPATPLLGARSQSPPAELRLQLQAAAALRRAAEGAAAAAAEGASSPATATAAAAAAAAGAAASASAAAPGATGAPFNNWIYVGYYSQLLHRFQAQEFLRQLALQHQQEQAAQKADPAAASKTAIPTQEEENADIRRKQARPLTGKHVRPGTGASPATLLTLRRKIQARQQQHDIKRILE